MIKKRNLYQHSSINYAHTEQEKKQLYSDIKLYKSQQIDELYDTESRVKHVGACLLDSSLITAYEKQSYQYKIIECGDYYYVYNFKRIKKKKDSNLEKLKDIKKTDINSLFKDEEQIKSRGDPKKIEYKNILRSKYEMQRLVKSNENIFKTFITLTFEENEKDIKKANKKFHWWVSNIKKLKKDFAYVAVPEFQKRGAVHYHLLTNLDIKQNPNIIIPQKGHKKMFDVVYWPHGYTSVFNLKDMNVVGYISKYMTKDIDNRLWGHRRYLYSYNLKRPTTIFLDSNTDKEFLTLIELKNTCSEQFKNSYYDVFGNEISFIEYKKRSD